MIFKHLSVENLNEKVTMNFFEFNANGLNIILGQKSPENDETNGVGKTALVETIRYCLGSSLPHSFSGKQKLKQNSLCAVLLLRIGNLEMRIARLYYDSSLVFVTSNPSVDNYSLSKWDTYKEDEYRKFIERLIYAALPNDASFSIPSFQAVREYLIRDEKNGFSDITLAQRNAVQNHQILAFLSLLPNNIESMISNQKGIIKNLQDELKIVNAIGKEIKDIKSSYDNTLLDIQLLQKQLNEADVSSKISFDERRYADLKRKLDGTQKKIHSLEYAKRQHESSIKTLQDNLEKVKDFIQLEDFYTQLLDYFPQSLHKNYEDMKSFYEFMLANRGDYFEQQIDKIQNQLTEHYKVQNIQLSELNECTRFMRNSEIVSDLREISSQITEKYKLIAEYEYKIDKYSEKKSIEKSIDEERNNLSALTKKYQDIYEESVSVVENIVTHFQQLTQIAYNESGYLAYQFINDQKISASTGRIKIQCSIDDEGAHGRYLMKINMFDIALLLNRIDSGNILPFLVHDGSYSKPAPAVKGNVLMHVDEYLKKQGRGQYFVTINIEELLENDVNIMRNNGMVVAELERDENDGKRFIGIKY